MPIKFLFSGGGLFWVWGAGECRFYFYGREDFSQMSREASFLLTVEVFLLTVRLFYLRWGNCRQRRPNQTSGQGGAVSKKTKPIFQHTLRAEMVTELILERAGPVIFNTFLLELIAVAVGLIPVICPARRAKTEIA